MTITETIEMEGIGKVTAHYSVECLQDQEIQMRMFRQFRTTEITDEEIAVWKAIYFGLDPTKPENFSQDKEAVTWREILCGVGPAHRCPILTGEITEQEISEWKEDYEKLKNINFAEVRKKYNVQFESDPYCDPPHQDYGMGGDPFGPFTGFPDCDINWKDLFDGLNH